MKRLYYILDEKKNVVPTDDLNEWGIFFESSDRIVAQDTINDILVSTVFIGLDHGFNSQRPVVFETMIFGGEFDQHQERYCTWNEALSGHIRCVEMIKPKTIPIQINIELIKN